MASSMAAVSHLAPTSAGARLRGHARLTRRKGRLCRLAEWLEDPAVAVGRGRRIRAILSGAAGDAWATTRISPGDG